MKNLKSEKVQVQFVLFFANLDLDDPDLRPGDLMNLRDMFAEYIALAESRKHKKEMVPTDIHLWDIQDEERRKRLKEILNKIQTKLRRYLDSLYGENFVKSPAHLKQLPYYMDVFNDTTQLLEASPEATVYKGALDDSSKGITLLLSVSGTRVDSIFPADLFLFRLTILLSKLAGKIFKCPLCAKYFLKRGLKRFCSPRCQVNWANKKYYRSQQVKKEVQKLHLEDGLSEEAIIKRLKSNSVLKVNKIEDLPKVSAWIAEAESKNKRASIRRSTTKRRK